MLTLEDDNKIYIIAEIGGNHNGDYSKAKEMVHATAEAGADAVKFQVYIPEKLCHSSQKPLPILKDRYKSQQERFRELVFSRSQYYELKQLADQVGIDFVATPFDRESADMLEPLVPFYKVASGDIDNLPLLNHLISKKKTILVSAGMSTMDEIDRLYDLIDHRHLAILHCISLYPTPADKLNLSTILTLKEKYPDITIGYSDHHIGIHACLYATVLGAQIIEKHFTFDKTIPYGDHVLSADYEDLKCMVKEIRQIERMMGDRLLQRSNEEMEKRIFFRRGVYAAREIRPGEHITVNDIILLRPPTEIKADEVDQVLGKTAKRLLKPEEAISWSDLQ